MLKGISPLLSPELLMVLSQMGHGDEIVIADANFPTQAYGQRALRADGIPAAELLRAILELFPLDQYDDENFILMEVVKGDPYVPVVWDSFKSVLHQFDQQAKVTFLERFAFYDRAKNAFAIIASGETAKYGNIILKKGVVE